MGQDRQVSKKRGRPRSDIAAEQLRELRSQGLSFRAMAQKLGLGYGTVRRAYWATERQISAAD